MEPENPGPSKSPTAPASGAVRLLCLDGGGVKGISSVMILDAIMRRVRELEGKPTNPKKEKEYLPHKYFDLAGGTSTGALAALMMFRLGMSTETTMKKYEQLSEKIFKPKVFGHDLHSWGKFGYYVGNGVLQMKKFVGLAGFAAEPLEAAIDAVVGDSNKEMKGDAPLVDESKPKMFMCATLVDRGETVLFRSYKPRDENWKPHEIERNRLLDGVTIKQAARATSAAPTYLPEMCIKGLRFWDGGLLNNNPVDQVWDTRFDLADDAKETPTVSCVVSIGTSWNTKKLGSGYFNTISQAVSFATNTEAKHRDFDRNIRRMNLRLDPAKQTMYFRFNAPTGETEFNLDDWQQMGKLKEHTSKYLKLPGTVDKIDQCARCLLRR